MQHTKPLDHLSITASVLPLIATAFHTVMHDQGLSLLDTLSKNILDLRVYIYITNLAQGNLLMVFQTLQPSMVVRM